MKKQQINALFIAVPQGAFAYECFFFVLEPGYLLPVFTETVHACTVVIKIIS